MIHPAMLQLQQHFALIREQQFTGALHAHASNGESWSLYYLMGRLVWASGGQHRLRRLKRLISPFVKDFNPNWVTVRQQHLSEFWEYRVFLALVKRQQIQQEQVIQVIRQAISEVLFDILLDGTRFDLDDGAATLIKQLGKVMVVLNGEAQLREAHRDWATWNSFGLASCSPNQAPTFADPEAFREHVSPETYAKLVKIVDGKVTLRELALQVGAPLPNLMRSLLPFIQRELIVFKDVPDLGTEPAVPRPAQRPEPPCWSGGLSTGDRPTAPVIVCIDDSPMVCKSMHTILTQANYQCVYIQDPLESILTLMDIKPQLVFLDLVMPIANGYEICAQIRRISVLKSIPVIILTGNDGIVDRVRAKLVGASDFMSKPIQPDKVLAVVQRYLSQPSAPQVPPASQLNSVSMALPSGQVASQPT